MTMISRFLTISFILFASTTALGAEPVQLSLISKQSCQLVSDFLYRCAPTNRVFPSFGIQTKHLPLRSRAQVISTGNCSTSLPVSISISSKINPSLKIEMSLVRSETMFLRMAEGEASGGLLINAANDWLKTAYFASDCVSELKVWQDELDLDSNSQVQLFLRKFSYNFSQSLKQRNLALYRPAFDLLKNLSESLITQLNSKMSDDVLDPDGKLSALLEKAKSSSSTDLGQGQREAVSRLQDFLDLQRTSTAWKSKKLSDFFNESDANAFKVISEIPDTDAVTAEDLKKYNLSVLEYCSDLPQLKAMLQQTNFSYDIKSFDILEQKCKVELRGSHG